MSLTKSIESVLSEEKLTLAAPLLLSECRVLREDKLARLGFSAESALILLVPYHPGGELHREENRNLSLYAVGRDYHLYFRGLFSRLAERFSALFPGYHFAGSADNSPIDERHAAVRAGLAVFGDNGLLITKRYGTYVFAGEIFSDLPAEMWGDVTLSEMRTCGHCGACRKACPMKNGPFSGECLSAVTQTKKANEKQLAYIRYYGSAWGCDRCQSVCPHNGNAEPSPVPFFSEELIPLITSERIAGMPEVEFSGRAYAWRGRETIMRNLELIEKDTAAGGISDRTAEKIMTLMRGAGEIIRSADDVEAHDGMIEEKAGTANFVTVYDVRVQEYLLPRLEELLPGSYCFAEEKENDPEKMKEGYCFVIDPIDGTTNFIHRTGTSAVSVGLLYKGTPVFGAVYDPYRNEMFYARRGLGAYLNGKRIHVSSRPADKALYAVGTAPYDKERMTEDTFVILKELFLSGADIRRSGSAALDLCSVACGRTDGFFEMKLSPWDYAAGALLISEAGGFITTPDGGELPFSVPVGAIAGTGFTKEILLNAAKKTRKA